MHLLRFPSTLDVVARALAMLLVERHGFAIRHVGRAQLQIFGRVDAGTAFLEIRTVQFEPFVSYRGLAFAAVT